MHLSFNYAVKSQAQHGDRVVTAGFLVQILAEAFHTTSTVSGVGFLPQSRGIHCRLMHER